MTRRQLLSSCRLFLLTAAIPFFAPYPALAQTGASKENRYVPIPLTGNIEALLRDRLRMIEENEPLKKLLEELQARHRDMNLDRGLLDKLDVENPGLRALLQELQAKQALGVKGKGLTPADVEEFQGKLQRLFAKHKPKGFGQPMPPGRGGPRNTVPAPPPAEKNGDNFARLAESWLRQADEGRLGGLLRDSPGFRKGLDDLHSLADFKSGAAWDVFEGLPDYLRFSENWNLSMPDKLFSGLEDVNLPELPSWNLPSVELGGVSMPSVNMPNFGGGVADAGDAIQVVSWLLIIGVALVAGWQLFRAARGAGAGAARLSGGLGPWPVDPGRIATRTELVRAFDYLAQLLLGTEVRSWNHRAVAGRLSRGSQPSPDARQAAQALGNLYELARYTEGNDSLSPAEQAAARRDLGLLAGTKPA